jgi:hypothetical protein
MYTPLAYMCVHYELDTRLTFFIAFLSGAIYEGIITEFKN